MNILTNLWDINHIILFFSYTMESGRATLEKSCMEGKKEVTLPDLISAHRWSKHDVWVWLLITYTLKLIGQYIWKKPHFINPSETCLTCIIFRVIIISSTACLFSLAMLNYAVELDFEIFGHGKWHTVLDVVSLGRGIGEERWASSTWMVRNLEYPK